MTVKLLALVPPDGCRWCGIPRRGHFQQWKQPAGWHQWEQPTQGQILARMQARRESRLNAAPTKYHATTAWAADATGESGEPYCADCKTDGCRQWIRIDTRLSNRRMELNGINPKRRTRTGGWGGNEPWPF